MTAPLAAAAVVYALDLQRMTAFYAGVTGLPVVISEPEHAVLRSGDFELTVVQISPEFASDIEITTPPERRSSTAIKVAFIVSSIAAVRTTAATLGGQVDGVEHEWSLHDYLISDGHDPEGNVIQLREYQGD